MNKVAFIMICFTVLTCLAQEGSVVLPQTSSVAKVTQSNAKIKFKSEIKNSLNTFSDSSQVSQWRLRLDPEIALDTTIVALRQDIKGKYSATSDITYLDDTRLMFGRTFAVGDFKFQPNLEAWLPTNLEFRNRTNYQGSPGVSLKAKTVAGRLKVGYEINGKQMNYGSDVKSSEASYKIYNELKNNINVSGKTSLNLDFKFSDDWDQLGKRSQKYEMQQGVAFKVDDHFDVQIGHLITKKNIYSDKSTKSVVVYDTRYSEFFTQVNYVY